MNLGKLLTRKQLTVLGINSGTSADGIDLAVVRINRQGSKVSVKFVAGVEKKYPPKIRELALTTADSRVMEIDQLVRLDQLLGQLYARIAAQYLKVLQRSKIKIDLIASHGQTVRHLPLARKWQGFEVRGSLQLGSPEQIAAETGLMTVGDFRQADIALGNEGAPITVAAMARLFAESKEPRLIVNIGGMSNFFYFPAGGRENRIEAADCGPGNSLCDLLSRRLFNEKFDRNGRRAARGQVSQRLLHLLLGEAFYNGGSVSTGRETFGPVMVDRIVAFGKRFDLDNEDLIATAAELTVRSIVACIKGPASRDKALRSLYLTGGGAHNRFLVRRLSELSGGLSVSNVGALGIDPGLVEAAAYAVMGEACLRSEALPTRFGRGRKQKVKPVLGRIVQPPV